MRIKKAKSFYDAIVERKGCWRRGAEVHEVTENTCLNKWCGRQWFDESKSAASIEQNNNFIFISQKQ